MVILAEVPGSKSVIFFPTSLEHVLAELRLLALRLHSRVDYLRRNGTPEDTDHFMGLYISEKEIDDILEYPLDWLFKGEAQPQNPGSKPLESKIEQFEKEIVARKQLALDRGIPLRLEILQNLFSLSHFEIETLLVCLLVEIDLRYQKLIAYLQEDVTKKAPTINLLLGLLCESHDCKLQNRRYFLPESPLFKYHLLSLHDDRVSGSTSLLTRNLQIDERIIGYLLDQDKIDSRLTASVSLLHPQKKLTDLVMSDELKNRLQLLVSSSKSNPLIACLSGIHRRDKRDIASAISRELDMPLLEVNLKAIFSQESSGNIPVTLIFREGCLQNAVVFIDLFDSISPESKETASIYPEFLRELACYPNWVLLGTEDESQPGIVIPGKPCLNMKLSSVTYAERLQTWEKIVHGGPGFAPDVNVADLAGKFSFNGSQISEAANIAKNLAAWRDPGSGVINNEDLYSACRKQSGKTLNAMARKIQPVYRWEDIILPKDQIEQLHEICSYVEHYHAVYDTWGFGKKVSLGKGLKVIFAGPSGTGKTMAAEVVAGELKIDLYKIDLSTIVSKYIGETEKNLEKIFYEGQTLNAILFFDEADALFGKRSEVRDAHDRYANIETAYLLQKMDEYDGTVILATNLRKNMDEAFARRMHFALEFPLPDEADRLRIWQQVFPRESPLDKDVDFKFLARQFKISGGNIKNIAVNAAFLAAAQGGRINMENLIKATKREYQKIGKLCTEPEFGRYFALVKN